jgi:hypothetical protein
VKSDVLHTLQTRINQIVGLDLDEIMFWAYELYLSGFQYEVFSLLNDAYNTHLDKPDTRFLGKRFQQCVAEWDEDKSKSWLLATIIYNIVRYMTPVAKKTKLFVRLPEKYDVKYFTRIVEPAYTTLEKRCKYAILQPEQKQQVDLNNWLYYAYGSPVWQKRIEDHSGYITEKHTIAFADEDLEQTFGELFGYELDEQSDDVYSLCGL